MMFKQKLKKRFHCTLIGNILEGFRIKQTYAQWLGRDKPEMIPHLVKQLAVKNLAKKCGIRVFIETGTFLGDMVAAVTNDFERIYSMEFSEDLFNRAAKKFEGHHHVTILHGESSQIMPDLLRHIDVPCLFWLDGHYSSGDSEKGKREATILKELKQIFNHPIKNHVILIDDAHLITEKNDSPTLKFLRNCAERGLSDHEFDVRNDIIRIYKKL